MKNPIIRKFKNFEWIVCEEPDHKQIKEIFSKYHIDDIDAEVVLMKDSRSKMDIHKDHTYLKLNFLRYSKDKDAFDTNEMHNIYSKDALFTFTTYSSNKLRSVIEEFSEKDFGGNVDGFLFLILDKQISKGTKMIDYLEKEITELEKTAYIKITKDIIRMIARKRKNIAVLKHMLRVDITVLESLEKHFENAGSGFYKKYRHLVHKSHKSFQEVLILEETVSGFDSTVKSLFEVKNNDVIKRISIVSFLFIPMNLAAGIFGMNLENVPFSHQIVMEIFLGLAIFTLIGGYIFRNYLFD